ncbi:MAG: hypothetical protein ACE366_20295 [Bradymonadia bacterium]
MRYTSALHPALWALVLTPLALTACDDDDSGATTGPEAGAGGAAGAGAAGGGAGGAEETCVPTAEAFASTHQATVDTYCGNCHGETPQFGAPYGLLDYDALVAGDVGSRPVDRLVARIRMGDMPPVGQPMIPAMAQNALLDWATCGENSGENPGGPTPGGFDVSRDPFPDPGTAPEGTAAVEWRADEGTIGESTDDLYRCYSFGGTEADRFIRRMEPIIDDARVLHHMVIYEVPNGPATGEEIPCQGNLDTILYAWAPGQQALQFPEGGLRTGPDHRYMLEIHYNNTAGYDDVADISGVRVYHGPPEGLEIGMLALGPEGFRVPANSRGEAEGMCEIEQETHVLATMPHMHEIGYALESTIIRADGTEEDLITLTGWDFDSQLFYAAGMTLNAGDHVTTRCVFENDRDEMVTFGPWTEDEMCYNFLYVYPPPSNNRCDQDPEAPNVDEFDYDAGACAPDGAGRISEVVTPGRLTAGEIPEAMGGALQEGLMPLVQAELALPSFDIGAGELDPEPDDSFFAMGGAVQYSEGKIALDVQGVLVLTTTRDMSFNAPIEISLAGDVIDVDNDAGVASVEITCGEGVGETLPMPYTVFENGHLQAIFPVDQLPGSFLVFTFGNP